MISTPTFILWFVGFFTFTAGVYLIYLFVYQWKYLDDCQMRTGKIVRRVMLSRKIGASIGDEADGNFYDTREYFYHVYVQFPLTKGQEVEVKCYEELPEEYVVGREVSVTYLEDPTQIKIDFRNRMEKKVRYQAMVFLAMVAFTALVSSWADIAEAQQL